MTSPSPYDRAVAHLKRSEYAEAIAAFTEAIQLDPESPNAFLGRALAHRALGDEAAAARDHEAAKALGGEERSAWDRLVNRAHRRWRGDLADPAWKRTDPLSRNAVLLRQWTWQIYNGGLPQWVANGYGAWAEDLARAAEEIGTPAARRMAEIVRETARVVRARPTAREVMFRMIAEGADGEQEQEIFADLSRCEELYYEASQQFADDVEEWFEKKAPRV